MRVCGNNIFLSSDLPRLGNGYSKRQQRGKNRRTVAIMAEKWITKEVELAQRHEEILLKREALLQGTEAYYDSQANRAASFIASFSMAERRNEELMQDLRECVQDLKTDATDPGTPKFNTLKNNYWMMVKNVFPVWQEELKEYQKRHGSALTSPYLLQSGSLQPGMSPRSPHPPISPSPPSTPRRSPTSTLRPVSPGRNLSPHNRPPSPPAPMAAKKSPRKHGGKGSKSKVKLKASGKTS